MPVQRAPAQRKQAALCSKKVPARSTFATTHHQQLTICWTSRKHDFLSQPGRAGAVFGLDAWCASSILTRTMATFLRQTHAATPEQTGTIDWHSSTLVIEIVQNTAESSMKGSSPQYHQQPVSLASYITAVNGLWRSSLSDLKVVKRPTASLKFTS